MTLGMWKTGVLASMLSVMGSVVHSIGFEGAHKE